MYVGHVDLTFNLAAVAHDESAGGVDSTFESSVDSKGIVEPKVADQVAA
jgi:hypothetical protein